MSVFRIGTAAGGRLLTASIHRKPGSNVLEYNIAQGENTRMIYGLIKEKNYKEAKSVLESKLNVFPKSRAALSLLGYCSYMLEDFEECVKHYKALVETLPNVERYRLSLAQSLYKSADYKECMKTVAPLIRSTDFEIQQQANKLVAYCWFEQKDLPAAKKFRRQGSKGDPDNVVLKGCILYEEGEIKKALNIFQKALQLQSKPSVAYNIAICLYQLHEYEEAFNIINEIIQKGADLHPELGVGTLAEGMEIRSVGNSLTLRNTALIETFNLKTAIHFVKKEFIKAELSVLNMPPRKPTELDAVTLHNKALLQMEKKPSEGIKILKHLLANPPFPEETFSNLLLILCRFGYYSHAGDVLAENEKLVSFLTPELWEFLNWIILSQTSPASGLKKLDAMANTHVQRLRKKLLDCRKIANQAQGGGDTNEAFEMAMKEYDELLDDYIPVLMHMCRIYWDIENYPEVERMLKESEELSKNDSTWKLNLAHSFFMQNTMEKFLECIKYYDEIVSNSKSTGNLLKIPPMILANMCTAHIMTNQNEEAEEVMRNIEREELEKTRKFPEEPILHLCIVNLVIGTLYCSKGHFEFGISRVIRSLEPYKQKLSTDTWFYAKRCFLALAESLSKHMVIITDLFFEDILNFLRNAERYGKNIKTAITSKSNTGADGRSMTVKREYSEAEGGKESDQKNTVFFEARLLRMLYLRIREDL